MTKVQLYKIKLTQGFNAKGRIRAGITLQKGITMTTELTDEQLTALNNDVWIDVVKADSKAVATTPVISAPKEAEAPVDEDEEEIDLSTKNFKELKDIATELQLDFTGLKSKAEIIKLIEESQATEE